MRSEKQNNRNSKNESSNGAQVDAPPSKLSQWPHQGMFEEYGGQHNCEGLESELKELEDVFLEFKDDDNLQRELRAILTDYGGRQTSLYHAKRLSRSVGGARIYIKREDLAHSGLIDMSNALSQVLLARRLKKSRLITSVLDPQQGLAIAMASKIYGMDLVIYMGSDSYQQFGDSNNEIHKIKEMGVPIQTISSGHRGCVDATSAAINEWRTSLKKSHLAMMLPLGPHPLPWIVRECQRVVGDEIKGQILRKERRLPDQVVVKYRSGSEVLGTFAPFVDDEFVQCVAVEIMREFSTSQNPLINGKPGVYAGTKSLYFEGESQNMSSSHYFEIPCPLAPPELAFLHAKGRIDYFQVTRQQAHDAYAQVLKTEGILLSSDAAHVFHALMDRARHLGQDGLIVGVIDGLASEDQWLESESPTLDVQQPPPISEHLSSNRLTT